MYVISARCHGVTSQVLYFLQARLTYLPSKFELYGFKSASLPQTHQVIDAQADIFLAEGRSS